MLKSHLAICFFLALSASSFAKEDRNAVVERAKGVMEILKNSDKNKDGQLAQKELIGHADLTGFDTDGDGTLSKTEYSAAKTELDDRITGMDKKKEKAAKKKKQEEKKKQEVKPGEEKKDDAKPSEKKV